MTERLVILGAGGHAKMVIESARSQGRYDPQLCLAQANDETAHILGVPVEAENDERLRELQSQGYWAFVALGSNRLRRKLTDKLEAMNFTIATIIAANVWLSPSAQIAAGTVLMPGSIIGAEVRVGRGAIINTGASIDHDCTVGEFVHIAPGCHLAGNVRVGELAFLGVGVSAIPEVEIGAYSIVGAGAVVVAPVPKEQVWVGCPARYLKSVS